MQGTPEDKLKAFVEEHGVTFPVTKGSSGPRTGNGIPRIVVFDVEGKSVFSGHPGSDDCEKAIKTALKAATPPEGEAEASSDTFFAKRELVPMRTWTNTDGNTLEASSGHRLAGTAGTFRKANGQTFPYDIEISSRPKTRPSSRSSQRGEGGGQQ